MAIHNDRKSKPINRSEVVKYLNHAFSRAVYQATSSGNLANRATRKVLDSGKVEKTPLYEFQVEFAYLIDSIQRVPAYIIAKHIQEANELITSVEELVKK